MADISNNTLSVIVGLALVVSLAGLFSLPNGGLVGFTGLGTTGEARINITETAALNVTNTVIDFSNGTITQGQVNCTLASDVSGDPLGCFTAAWSSNDGPYGVGLTVDNTGNVALNVTVTSTKDASTFWGVSGGRYMYKCTGNGTSAQSTYADISGATQDCVMNVSASVGSNSFRLDVNITIPKTATGFKNDTLTFTATKA